MKLSLCMFLLPLLAVASASDPSQVYSRVAMVHDALNRGSDRFDHLTARLSMMSDPNTQDPRIMSDTMRESAGYVQDILTAIHALADSDARFAPLIPHLDQAMQRNVAQLERRSDPEAGVGVGSNPVPRFEEVRARAMAVSSGINHAREQLDNSADPGEGSDEGDSLSGLLSGLVSGLTGVISAVTDTLSSAVS